MSRTNPVFLALALLAVLAYAGGAAVISPALYIDKHDGDVLHLLDIVFRMAAGQVPHEDFMTPLGGLSFWPISHFLARGYGIGAAAVHGQIWFALALLLPTWWVSMTRYSGLWAYIFGASVLLLCTALIFGGSDVNLSLSMHYNRWAWALAFLALSIAMLEAPEGFGVRVIDAAILGLAMTALGMLKVTFVVALAPPVVLILLVRAEFALLTLSLFVTAASVGLLTILLGPGYWAAYAGDLMATAQSELRSFPGVDLPTLLTGPAFLPATALTLLGVIMLRRTQKLPEGLGLLLLFPGFTYIVWQNFGNDPKWLWLLGLMMMTLRPVPGRRPTTSGDPRLALSATGLAMMAIVAPSFLNLAFSPLRNLHQDDAAFVALLPNAPRHADYRILTIQARRYDVVEPGSIDGSGMEWTRETAGRAPEIEFEGQVFRNCYLKSGLVAWTQTIAADLVDAGFDQGQRILPADLIGVFWLFEDGIAPVRGAAPWIYGGMPGWDNATHVLVPTCPVAPQVRAYWLEKIAETGAALTEVRRTPLYTLYEKPNG